MAERDEVGRPLGGENAGRARGAEHVALRRVATADGGQRGRLHLDDGTRDRLADGLGLGRDIDHARVTTGGQMRKAAEALVADGLPRPCQSSTPQALTPGRACRMMDSIRSLAISLSFLSSLIRHCWSVESGAVPRSVSNSCS